MSGWSTSPALHTKASDLSWTQERSRSQSKRDRVKARLKRSKPNWEVLWRCWHELSIVTILASLFYMSAAPYQLAYELRIEFSALYVIGYITDASVCTMAFRGILKKWAALESAKSGEKVKNKLRVRLLIVSLPNIVCMALCAPIDIFLWVSAGARSAIPWVRLFRVVYAAPAFSSQLGKLEVESAGLSYFQARALRLSMLVILLCHILACAFFEFTKLPGAVHYKYARSAQPYRLLLICCSCKGVEGEKWQGQGHVGLRKRKERGEGRRWSGRGTAHLQDFLCCSSDGW